MHQTRFCCACACCVAAPAAAEPLANQLFGAKDDRRRADRRCRSASYARGCAAGLVELPETGPTWQAMRLSRNRNWGQPVMIDLSEGPVGQARGSSAGHGLYIGDISQPRGGPMTSGHASHQIGLDADIWMLPPPRLNLIAAEREKISSIPVRSADQRSVTDNWTPAHARVAEGGRLGPAGGPHLRRRRGQDRDVQDRQRKADKNWLQKIRPDGRA